MALVLVGRTDSSFPSRDDKNVQIVGVNLHCIEDVVDPKDGQRVQTFYIHEKKPGYSESFKVPYGSVVTPVYNRFGKVEDILWKSPEEKK